MQVARNALPPRMSAFLSTAATETEMALMGASCKPTHLPDSLDINSCSLYVQRFSNIKDTFRRLDTTLSK